MTGDRRPAPQRVGSVTLLASPLAVARQRCRLTVGDAARQIGVSELQLARLEKYTRRLTPRTQAALIGRLAPPTGLIS